MFHRVSLFFDELYRDRRKRSIYLLALCLAILAARFFVIFHDDAPPVPILVKCPRCAYSGVLDNPDMEKEACPKCGARLGYVFHCFDCGREYPVLRRPMSELATLSRERVEEMTLLDKRCPNCGSDNTWAMSVQLRAAMEDMRKRAVEEAAEDSSGKKGGGLKLTF